MVARGFDEIARLLASARSRRRLLPLLAATVAGVPSSARRDAPARARRCRRLNKKCKKRDRCCHGAKCKRRKCRCAGGTKACDGRCIPADGCCTVGNCPTADECKLVECVGNQCVVSPTPRGTPCGLNRTFPCDGEGNCGNISCVDSSTCPGEVTECQSVACQNGFCWITYASFGWPLAAQIVGNCYQEVCAGNGGTAMIRDPTDVVDDGNECTQFICNANDEPNPPEDAGTPCTQNGGRVCDGDGNCVQCLDAGDCDDGQTCVDFACV